MDHTRGDRWLEDVYRSGRQALQDWNSVLDGLEKILDEPWNAGGSSVRNSLISLNAVVRASENASGRLQNSFRTIRSRQNDLDRAGVSYPVENPLLSAAREAGERSRYLGERLQERMKLIGGELASRKPRRPRNRPFSSHPPSLLDIHV